MQIKNFPMTDSDIPCLFVTVTYILFFSLYVIQFSLHVVFSSLTCRVIPFVVCE